MVQGPPTPEPLGNHKCPRWEQYLWQCGGGGWRASVSSSSLVFQKACLPLLSPLGTSLSHVLPVCLLAGLLRASEIFCDLPQAPCEQKGCLLGVSPGRVTSSCFIGPPATLAGQ